MSKKSNRPLERQLRVLEVVLQHIKENPDEETFRIPFDEFSTKDPLFKDREGLEIAFEKINTSGKAISIEIETVETGTITTITGGKITEGYDAVKIHVEDPDVLRQYLKDLKAGVVVDTTSRVIRKLTLVKLVGTKREIKFVINDDYDNVREGTASSWITLLSIAEGEDASASEYKAVKDYFNSNSGCQLYSRTGFVKTKILEAKNGFLIPAVEMGVIDEKTLKRRQNSVLKDA